MRDIRDVARQLEAVCPRGPNSKGTYSPIHLRPPTNPRPSQPTLPAQVRVYFLNIKDLTRATTLYSRVYQRDRLGLRLGHSSNVRVYIPFANDPTKATTLVVSIKGTDSASASATAQMFTSNSPSSTSPPDLPKTLCSRVYQRDRLGLIFSLKTKPKPPCPATHQSCLSNGPTKQQPQPQPI
jgi:hypothetical protein